MTQIDSLETAICLDHELTIDTDLMNSLESISEKRATIANLLEKTSKHAESIKHSIYQRVARDYEARLAEVLTELEPLAHTISENLGVIAALELKIRERLVLVEDQIEEQTFRCLVGEFNEQSRNEKVATLDTIKATLEEQVTTLEHTYADCEAHLGDSWRSQDIVIEPQPDSDPSVSSSIASSFDESLEGSGAEDSEMLTPTLSMDPPDASVPDVIAEMPSDDEGNSTENMSELALIHQPATAEQAVVRAELQACLQLFNTKGEIETFEVGHQGLSIGKSSANDIVLRRAGVSRKHATVTSLEAGRFHVVDHSGRGIAINGQIKEEGIIGCGDVISIAKVDLELMPVS